MQSQAAAYGGGRLVFHLRKEHILSVIEDKVLWGISGPTMENITQLKA
jgi:hypothetical protein